MPPAQGLYDPAREHDSCGVGFVADMRNRKSHDILEKGLQILVNLDHRGAVGADPSLGDGCGVLTQIPHGFFAPECAKLGFDLPAPGRYAIGQFFMPRQAAARRQVREIVEEAIAAEGLGVLGWRDVPVDNSGLGERVKAVEPVMQQIFIGRPADVANEDDFERRLFVARKVVSNRVYAIGSREILEYYPVSMSARTIVYKGMVLVRQLAPYYRDLMDPRYRDRAGVGPPALRDQHISVVAPCAPLSHGRAQRRNQHAARQRQLDGRASGERRFRVVRRRYLEAVADLL